MFRNNVGVRHPKKLCELGLVSILTLEKGKVRECFLFVQHEIPRTTELLNLLHQTNIGELH